MQRYEKVHQAPENIIFESPAVEALHEELIEAVSDIMDIPGTAYEKLVALSEMI